MLAKNTRTLGAILLGLAITGSAPAAIPVDPSEPSPDVRQKMAALHEQMATCLRSDRVFSACQAQMVKSCREQLGNDCRIIGQGGGGARRMHPMTPESAGK
jgi:hypothetical protein